MEIELTEKQMKDAEEMQEYFLREYIEPPSLVFKYKSISEQKYLDRVIDILKNKRIYMPSIQQLNDPLESTNSLLLGISEEERQNEFNKYRVLSLSANPLLPTLWAYYADNYKGVCFGFWTNKTFSSIRKMNYLKEQEMVSWELNIEDLFKKAAVWEHEDEYRTISNNDYLNFDEDDLACIIFGTHIDKTHREQIEKVIPKKLPVFTVKAETSRFCLCLEQKIYDVKTLEKILREEKNKNG